MIRSQNRNFKSPLNKNCVAPSQSLMSAVPPKLLLKSGFQSKCPKAIETSRT